MYNELLIKALRWCADESICCDDFSGEKCPYFDEKKGSCSADEILHAAADEIEAADKRIAELSLDCEMFQQKCMELDAQKPKEGKWVMCKSEKPYVVGKCSLCGEMSSERGHYCPNCGAKMKNVTDCHTLEEVER